MKAPTAFLFFAGFLAACTSISFAQEANFPSPRSIANMARPNPRPSSPESLAKNKPFRTQSVSMRRNASGNSFSVFGGVSMFQDSTDANLVLNSVTIDSSLDDDLALLGGIKFAHTWSAQEIPFIQFPDDDSFRMLPTMEFEAMYMHWKNDDSRGSSGGVSTDKDTRFDAGLFFVNGIMKFEAGFLRPYAGVGLGGAVMRADSNVTASNGTSLSGNDIDVALALQGIGGVEAFVARGWSIFAEYKYIHIDDLEFDYSRYDEEYGDLAFHCIVGGVRLHF